MATGIPKKVRLKKSSLSCEKAELSYGGKESVSSIINNTKAADLEEILNVQGYNNVMNYLLFGDNLEILKSLCENKDIAGKVKLIYIDPPYAKNAVFKSRSQEHAYDDVLYGVHYIEFLRKRLVLMRELLAEDGSIYVHLDESMAFPIKIIMDEVFGEINFRNWITRQKSNPKNSTKKRYGNVADYIMFYSKSNKYIFNQQFTSWEGEEAYKEYSYIEEITGRRYKKVPIHAPGVRNGETGKMWKGMLPPPGKHWQYTPDRLDEMDKNGEIYWSPTGNPRKKIYLDENKGKPVQDIWLEFKDAHNQNIKITGYPTEKNEDLLQRIISASSNEGDLVLDAFAGSGTTLAVAEKLGRRWIGIDSSPLSIKTTLLRLLYGSEKMGDFRTKKKKLAQQTELLSSKLLLSTVRLLVNSDEKCEYSEHIDEWKNITKKVNC